MLMRIEKEIEMPKKISNLRLVKKGKVLLIENHPDLLKKNQAILESLGYEVDTATTNGELIAKSAHEYAAVFTRPYHKDLNAWMGAKMFMAGSHPSKVFILAYSLDVFSKNYFIKSGITKILNLPLDADEIKKALG